MFEVSTELGSHHYWNSLPESPYKRAPTHFKKVLRSRGGRKKGGQNIKENFIIVDGRLIYNNFFQTKKQFLNNLSLLIFVFFSSCELETAILDVLRVGG